jgi:hypothetical protein
MTLENLIRIGRLHLHTATDDELRRLLNAADRHLADASVEALSSESRFEIAYRAAMQYALVALLASGYRPATSEPGHHATVLQSLAKTIGLPADRLIVLDHLRRKRNLSEYTGDDVGIEIAEATIRAAIQLENDVKRWLKARRSD